MADFFPFDSGQGSNVTEAQWGLMAQNWLGTGVLKGKLNEFLAYADSTGMQVKVKSGQAWVQGFFFQVVTEMVVPISAANATNPRIDRIAVQVDWTNNNISLIAIQGTPAASPIPPALTQNTSIWQISLAQVYVGANVSTIVAGNITDERYMVGGLTPYFHLNNNSTQSYDTTGAFSYVTFNSGHVTNYRDTTPKTNSVAVNQAGIYYVESLLHISGLNSGITATLTNRQVDANNNLIADHSMPVIGWQGAGGNTGGVWLHNAKLLKMNKGDMLNVLIQIGESPRSIYQLIVNCFKVSE